MDNLYEITSQGSIDELISLIQKVDQIDSNDPSRISLIDQLREGVSTQVLKPLISRLKNQADASKPSDKLEKSAERVIDSVEKVNEQVIKLSEDINAKLSKVDIEVVNRSLTNISNAFAFKLLPAINGMTSNFSSFNLNIKSTLAKLNANFSTFVSSVEGGNKKFNKLFESPIFAQAQKDLFSYGAAKKNLKELLGRRRSGKITKEQYFKSPVRERYDKTKKQFQRNSPFLSTIVQKGAMPVVLTGFDLKTIERQKLKELLKDVFKFRGEGRSYARSEKASKEQKPLPGLPSFFAFTVATGALLGVANRAFDFTKKLSEYESVLTAAAKMSVSVLSKVANVGANVGFKAASKVGNFFTSKKTPPKLPPATSTASSAVKTTTSSPVVKKGTQLLSKLPGVMKNAIRLIGPSARVLLKRIPIIGSLFDFAEAIKRYERGGISGMIQGTISLAAGIANFFPGIGTVISIGLNVLNAILDKTVFQEENAKLQEQIDINPSSGIKDSLTRARDNIWENIKDFGFVKYVMRMSEAGKKAFETGSIKDWIKFLMCLTPTNYFLQEALGLYETGLKHLKKWTGDEEVDENIVIRDPNLNIDQSNDIDQKQKVKQRKQVNDGMIPVAMNYRQQQKQSPVSSVDRGLRKSTLVTPSSTGDVLTEFAENDTIIAHQPNDLLDKRMTEMTSSINNINAILGSIVNVLNIDEIINVLNNIAENSGNSTSGGEGGGVHNTPPRDLIHDFRSKYWNDNLRTV